MKNYNLQLNTYKILLDKNNVPILFDTLHNKEVKTCINRSGYRIVAIRCTGRAPLTMTFARAIMMLHDPRPDYDGLQVDHINRNRLDDRLENLRWVTPSENALNTKERVQSHHTPTIYIYDFNENKVYIWDKKKKYNLKWSRSSLNGLARGQGPIKTPHYSRKLNIMCLFETEFFDKNRDA